MSKAILLLNRAKTANIKCELILNSKPETRRISSIGSTFVPKKVIILNDIRMSFGQAKQYLKARGA